MKDKDLKEWVKRASEEFEPSPETAARLRAQIEAVRPAPRPRLPIWRKALAGGLAGLVVLAAAAGGWAFVSERGARQPVYADGLANITAGQFQNHARVRQVRADFLPDSQLVRYTEYASGGALRCFGVTYREGEVTVRLDFAVGDYNHPDLALNDGDYEEVLIDGQRVRAVRTEVRADYYAFEAGQTLCCLMVRADGDGSVARELIAQLI